MEHLSLMGEGTASINRQYAVGTDTFLAMAAIYQGERGLSRCSKHYGEYDKYQHVQMYGTRVDEQTRVKRGER